MPRCSASGCRNMGSHTFPKDPHKRALWEKAMNKENFKASKHSRLCYDHFKPSDYPDVSSSLGTTPYHRFLKKSAVPSIFPKNVRQNRRSVSGVAEAKPSRRQQLSRHLKKGVVPSIFPWTKKPVPTADASEEQKATSRPVLKNTAVPSKFPWNEANPGIRHQTNKNRYQRFYRRNGKKFSLQAEINSDNECYGSPSKDKEVKKEAVSPQNTPIKEERTDSTETNSVLRNRSVRLKNRKAYLLNRRCSVPLCNSRPSNEITLHPCPNNAAVRNEWAEALRVSYQYVKNMVACSLHFTKLNFIHSSNSERILKHNAVPSRNLPIHKKTGGPSKHKIVKKDGSTSAFERQKTMTETADETKESLIPEELIRECRACLKKLDTKKSCCNVFQPWAPPWEGMESTIAEDLAKLANVEISQLDRHSKVLCSPCYQRLLDAASFAATVRNCDLLLRMRFTADIDMEKVWPKPIQVDKNINGSVFNNPMDIEIKQEVVSDEEYPVNGSDNPYVETELSTLDIKIEPEELVEPPPMNITINGTISLDPLNSENHDVKKGDEIIQETNCIQMEIKQEPTSEGEQEIEAIPDLPLECLLCSKSFNSVTGLKAHVIAQHSYKTVKRKADGSVSPEKKRCDLHQCAICKRSFQTPTDLMVHETCHNKHACYGCTEKFDTFELLTRHRKRCKASIAKSVQKLKTLEDVKRPVPEEKVDYLEIEIERVESVAADKENQDVEMKELEPIKNDDVEMKDIGSEQIEESSQENEPESLNDNTEHDKTLECAKEDESDNKLESAEIEAETKKSENGVEEIDSEKKSESGIEEVDNEKKSESGVEEIDNEEKSESGIEEVDNEKKSECGIEVDNETKVEYRIELHNENKLQSGIEEVNSEMRPESVIEEDDIEKQLQSLIQGEDGMTPENLTENLDNVEQLLCVIQEVESVLKDADSEEKLESVKVELESIIKEEDDDNKIAETEKEELVTEEMKTETKIKELEDPDSSMKLHLEIHSTKNDTEPTVCDTDMPIETLDNDDCT